MTYLEELQSTLDTSKEMLGLLEKRIEILNKELNKVGEEVYSTEYEINEFKINIIKTKGEINTLRSIIFEKEKYFEKFAKQFEVEKAEMEHNFDNILKQIKIRRLKDEKLDNLMKGVDMEKVLSSVETKLAFYKTIKSFLKI
jgi:septal ring factor EnvC (AmiA/AmiB activator)